MIRVVLDANVFVSGLLSNRGATAGLLDALGEGRYEAIACPRLLEEIERVLRRPKFAAYVSTDDVEPFVSWVRRTAIVVDDPPDVAGTTRDPHDDYLIALALDAGAHVLVSGDKDLTDLKIERLPVLSPRALLDELGRGERA